jgi:N-acetyl-alpha-D-muramate 1-phosphate uridylyltransferase
MIKKAMILAAGFGKRLNPLTITCPKPLLKIGNETLLSNTIKFLEKIKIDHVVINVHHLGDQIVNYIKKKKFNLSITVIKEEKNILDTGGGVKNAINHFSSEDFLIINPDTIWNTKYINEVNQMYKVFSLNKKNYCTMLVVNKLKSYDKSFKGDFSLKNSLINRKEKNELKYIYTGIQIINPEVFISLEESSFSMNKVWNKLMENSELFGVESQIEFFHASTLDIYNSLSKKF